MVGAKQAVDNAAGSAEKKEEKDEKKEEVRRGRGCMPWYIPCAQAV